MEELRGGEKGKIMNRILTQDDFLAALRYVETGGAPNGGVDYLGDGGAALGPLQIHRECWADAMDQYAKETGRTVKTCRNQSPYRFVGSWLGSVFVARLYFKRYAKKSWDSGDWEKVARIWNGGPTGHRKKATLPYWEKVKKALAHIEQNKNKEAQS